ncbi:MAG: nucleoside triphosphate pyrophosphohydrolase [Gammaproteobacteria bacterium]|jgi:ATP diphosphatase|nr:nucleoside triphosphate pyrophosphohydrolase [Gammaproteobacteria bacterium]
MSTKNPMQALLEMMANLRSENGCPWDRAQTFESIVPHTLEEAYEVQDAIENGTPEDIKSEVGDLLLQILFYCQMGKEKGWFDFEAVARQLQDKLIKRHPHVFQDHAMKTEDHHDLWESLKEKERQEKHQDKNFVLTGVALNLPALSRAQKLQERAARVGFDWPHIQFVLDKIQEEIKEFEHSYKENEIEEAKEELGDILFVCANLARHLKTDAESILRKANQKFERRFNGVESKVVSSDKPWDAFTLEELDRFWDEVKEEERLR